MEKVILKKEITDRNMKSQRKRRVSEEAHETQQKHRLTPEGRADNKRGQGGAAAG